MKTIITDVFLALMIILVFWIFSPDKYTNALDVQEIQAVKQTMVVITTKAKVELNGVEREAEMNGIALLLDNGIVLAETHTTQTKEVLMVRMPFGFISVTRKVLEERWFIGDTEIELIGRHRDISLFRIDKETHQAVPFGDSDLLEIGTDIVIIGWSFGRGVNVKTGIVSRFITTENYNPPSDSINGIAIMTDAPVNPGDSGSPVLAMRDGHYELIGLASGMIKDHGMGFFYHINFIKEAINEITS